LLRLQIAVYGGALLVALLTVFVIWGAQGAVEQASDIYKFAELGKNISEGHGLRYADGPPTIRRAPLYPGIIALLYLIFGPNLVVVQVEQAFLAAGTCLLVFEIGRRLFSQRIGLIASALTVFHPMVMRYVPDVQLETTLTFFYTLAVHRSIRLVQSPSLANGFWFGAAAAAAAMTKGVGLPYPALFILAYLVWRWRKGGDIRAAAQAVPAVAAIIVAMALFILPWTYRNYQVTGGRIALVSGNASGEFLRGYVFAQPRYYLLRDRPYVEGENEANEMQRALFRSQGLVWERDEAETERVQNVAAREKIASSPLAFVKKSVIAFFMFWYVVTTAKNSLLVGGLALGAWALAALGFLRAPQYRASIPWLLLPILSLNLIYAAVLSLGRYSAPCIPTLLVLAAVGIDTLLPQRAKAWIPA